MSHKPIQLKNISLSFPQKICFENFSAEVQSGSFVTLVGQNGCGKSTLLKIVQGIMPCSEGEVIIPKGIVFGYVPQVINSFETLSGGERVNKWLTQALALKPDILLLDEPTNHLDAHNKKSVIRLLRSFPGTVIIVTHDRDVLTLCTDTLWHIDQGKIRSFSGGYEDYRQEISLKRASIEKELTLLNHQKKFLHQSLMKEQVRAKKSRAQGGKHIEHRKWPTIVSTAKAHRAEETSGHKKKQIHHRKEELLNKLGDIRLPEAIIPTFSLKAGDVSDKVLVSICDGVIGYEQPLLTNIHFSLSGRDRVVLVGSNGSGKSTFIKGILGDSSVRTSGQWLVPKREEIGYLDQHYETLNPQETVLETIQKCVPRWSHAEIRHHLNDFLFRKNEEVNASVSTLSGGEKARLSLAQIAASTPKLLILDELTNNLDLETREHVIQVLKAYPGALILISHDSAFLETLQVTNRIQVTQFC